MHDITYTVSPSTPSCVSPRDFDADDFTDLGPAAMDDNSLGPAEIDEAFATLTKLEVEDSELHHLLMDLRFSLPPAATTVDFSAAYHSLTLETAFHHYMDELAKGKCELAKEKCVKEERVADEKQRRIEKAQRIVRRLLYGNFDSYAYSVGGERQQRETCRRVVLKMRQLRALAGAFDMFIGFKDRGSMRQHTSAYVTIRHQTLRQHTSAYSSMRQ
jgi:hypothetical protein